MKKVLIIEDEDLVRQMLHDFLKNSGYEPHIINNVELDKIKAISKNFDVILCDLMMPAISGYDIVNSVDSENRKKIVLITGGYIDTEKQDFFDKERVNIMYKPFDLKECLKLLNKICSENLCKEN